MCIFHVQFSFDCIIFHTNLGERYSNPWKNSFFLKKKEKKTHKQRKTFHGFLVFLSESKTTCKYQIIPSPVHGYDIARIDSNCVFLSVPYWHWKIIRARNVYTNEYHISTIEMCVSRLARRHGKVWKHHYH